MKLVIKDLSKKFDDQIVLENVNFEFEKGKIYGLVGRNGSGKTTFFSCINNDINFDKGEIYLENNGEISKLKDENIGFVVSEAIVPEFLTGREFLTFFISVNKDKIKDLKQIDEYFDFLQIEEASRDKLIKDYSLGMKNKMQMIINFMCSPEILLLDEPLTSFDVVVADEMKKMFKKIKADHILIFSTHILEIAIDLCDEIVIINEKKLELIDKNDLDNLSFKDKIINALRGDNND